MANNTTNPGNKCTDLHSLAPGEKFTHTFNTTVNNRSIALSLGRMCQSGFGILLDNKNAVCVELTNITSNIDGHFTGLSLGTPQVALQTFKTCNLSFT